MLQYILDGGWIMIPLMCLSVMAVAVIIDRLRAFRMADVDTTHLRVQVNDLLDQGNIDDAIRACESSSGPVSAVLLAGLDNYRKLAARGRSTAEIEINVTKTMEDYAPHVLEALQKRLNLLTMIASVSPLLGMTGTVTGMIKSFNKMAEMAGMDPGAVSGGIAEALITTATGLIIAMPAVVAYVVFSKKVDRFALEIEEAIRMLMDFISLRAARR